MCKCPDKHFQLDWLEDQGRRVLLPFCDVCGAVDSNEYCTPLKIFNKAGELFNIQFDLDVCTTEQNTLCKNYFTETDDAMNINWADNSWCNPPYSGKNKETKSYGLLAWVMKASMESFVNGVHSVLLIPSDTSTKYMEFCHSHASAIAFLPRIKFVGATQAAKFGSMLVNFNPAYIGECKYSVIRNI